MFTFQGIAVDSYVMFESNCSVSCQVNGSEIEIVLGHGAGSLHLVTNEEGLAKLLPILAEVSARLLTLPDDTPATFHLPN